jgi:hypothetical protein
LRIGGQIPEIAARLLDLTRDERREAHRICSKIGMASSNGNLPAGGRFGQASGVFERGFSAFTRWPTRGFRPQGAVSRRAFSPHFSL